jgi:hypothetical protein
VEGEEDVIAGAGGEEVDEADVEEPVGVAAEFTVETPYISQNVINRFSPFHIAMPGIAHID